MIFAIFSVFDFDIGPTIALAVFVDWFGEPVDVRLDMSDKDIDRRFHAINDRLGVDTHEHDRSDERHHDGDLAEVQILGLGILFGDRSVEHPLVGPQQIERGQDHTGCGRNSPPSVRYEGPNENQELANEAVQTRQADRTQHDQGEHGGHDRCDLLQATEFGNFTGVTSFVDPADQQEQCTGGHTVVDHLQDATSDAFAVERERAQDDETKVGNR